MHNAIKFVHTNLIAKDWKSLSKFYIDVFGCKPTYPERDLSGEWLEKITEIKNARIRGMHLSLPGYENGPTLEIFQYSPENLRTNSPTINMQGFGHIAFHVEDVPEVLEKLIEHGGTLFGEVAQKQYPELGLLTVAYTRDPEGNFIELQNWKK
jgi:predicted enzyme related to lactoylglutathione lyase